MKKFFKIILFVFSGILLTFLLLWFGIRTLFTLSVADYSGEISLNRIVKPVEITFDARGIPQIWAKNEKDAYFAVGWLHASERLFQMELIRRLMSGELSELFGKNLYSIDVGQRQIGFARKAERDLNSLSPHSRLILKSYCAGINSWINYKNILPPEFIILHFTPRFWKPKDCLGILLYQTWFSHALMDKDRNFNDIIDIYGNSIRELLQEKKTWSPATIPLSYLKNLFKRQRFPLKMGQASNSWVVSPAKSISGAALHASDPHLSINTIPGFWYILGIHIAEAGGFDVLGITTPGVPFIVMGHNKSICFAFTVASVDIIDYFLEKRQLNHPDFVLTDTGYKKMSAFKEKIIVKGEKLPRLITVYQTENGAVVDSDSKTVTSLKWVGFNFSSASIVEAAFNLQQAKDFSEFKLAVTHFGGLDVNWTFSDKQGNIGYQLGTPIPKRKYSNTFEIHAGEATDSKWEGYYSSNQTPSMFNPESGWLASCNNRIADKWQFPLPGFYDPYRIIRVAKLLNSKKSFSVKDMQDFQMDRISILALRWKLLMQEGAAKLKRTDLVDEIKTWNGEMNKENRTAALFTLWWKFITKEIFQESLGQNWEKGKFLKDEILSNPNDNVIEALLRKNGKLNNVLISKKTLKSVLTNFKREAFGSLCSQTLSHPLSRIKLLDYWLHLNRGPFPAAGDPSTLNSNFYYFNEKKRKFITAAGPSMRFVLDWSDIDAFTINTNLGQSGNPASPHYDDFFQYMHSGKRWIVPFSREIVFKRKNSLLKLLPVN